MEKLKPEKKKHNHKLTDYVKVGIFSILLMAPFIAVGVKCGYVILNKNAKDSYYGETINETEYVKVNNLGDLNNHNYTYQLVLNNDNNTSISGTQLLTYTSALYISGTVGENTQTRINNSIKMILYYSNDSRVIEVVDNNNVSSYVTLTTHSMVINIENPTLNESSFQYWKQYLYIIEYNDYSYLDNVFYYAVDELGNNDLFSWTKNTALYNGVNAMTSGLEIDTTNNILALLITYWSLITISYVIIDIVIELFIKLTHFMVE